LTVSWSFDSLGTTAARTWTQLLQHACVRIARRCRGLNARSAAFKPSEPGRLMTATPSDHAVYAGGVVVVEHRAEVRSGRLAPSANSGLKTTTCRRRKERCGSGLAIPTPQSLAGSFPSRRTRASPKPLRSCRVLGLNPTPAAAI